MTHPSGHGTALAAPRRISLGPAARLCVTATCWLALGFGTGLTLAVASPGALGHRVFTVLSGSMEPTLRTGDLVVDAKIAPLDARVGDVVTFPDPDSPGRLVTHRVRSVTAAGATVRFETKGDQNNAVERWSIPADGKLGRVVYRVPKLGYVTSLAGSRLGLLGLVVLPALLLGIFELKRIWTAEEKGAADEDAA